MLERLDPNPEYWEGKRGAAVGVFQMIIAGREDRSVGEEKKKMLILKLIIAFQTSACGCHSDFKKHLQPPGN